MMLWLDDVRDPAEHGAIGSVWCKTVSEAKALLAAGCVTSASLDHDLGTCSECAALTGIVTAGCTHVGTGYDLCVWMAETGHWPARPPVVHSANPVGRERMRGVIARDFGQHMGGQA